MKALALSPAAEADIDKIWDYTDSRVNPYTVKIGQEMLSKHGRLLTALENHFGVDKHVLLAIWSMESNYGAALERPDRLHNVPRSLATLAYADRKRAKFARTRRDIELQQQELLQKALLEEHQLSL